MCEIHHQIVHIYFLLHTHTQEKALSAQMELGKLQRETFPEMQLSPLLFFSLSKFYGLLFTSIFLIAPAPIHRHAPPKTTNESYLYL